MKRSEIREFAFSILFEYSFKPDENIEDVLKRTASVQSVPLESDGYLYRVVVGVAEHLDELDRMIEENAIDWKKERLSRVALSILRLACYEILYESHISHAVTINEAVELAKKFDGADTSAFINGVLGAAVKGLKPPSVSENIEPEATTTMSWE